jgi:cytochrome c biogenesis protein CcdA
VLASITPLGERGRNSRYAVTAIAFVAGATGGGALLGTIFGALGSASLTEISAKGRLGILAVVIAMTFVAELWRLPTIRRQVNEEWMHAYRGWVYGFGYGAQLGAGVTTIVTTGAIYAMLVAEALTTHVGYGASIGTIFGFTRGITLLAGAAIRTPRGLVTLDAALRRGERPASWMARSGQVAVALICLGWLLR